MAQYYALLRLLKLFKNTHRYPALNASSTVALVSPLWNTPKPSKGIVWPEESLTVDVKANLDAIGKIWKVNTITKRV